MKATTKSIKLLPEFKEFNMDNITISQYENGIIKIGIFNEEMYQGGLIYDAKSDTIKEIDLGGR